VGECRCVGGCGWLDVGVNVWVSVDVCVCVCVQLAVNFFYEVAKSTWMGRSALGTL